VSEGPRWWRRLLSAVVEYLTLRRALAFAEGVHDDRRASLRTAAAEASQKRDAAELLRSRGSLAEAIRLALEGAELLTGSLQAVAENSPVQTRAVHRAALDAKWAAAELTPAPALDRAVTSAHGRALRTLLAAELALGQPLREALLDRRGLLVLRLQRILAVAALVASPFAVALFVRRSYYGPAARASGTLDDQYAADRVLDGDPDTEWVASGGEEWLELRFHRQTVHGLRVLNGDTLPDRAVKEMRADFYDGKDLHATATRTFSQQHPAQWQTYDVGRMPCDRIRLVITQHHGSGAAIAEVQVY
jgi:hypothetical protein